jgi:hypothetical protein
MSYRVVIVEAEDTPDPRDVLAAAIRAGDVGRVSDLLLSLPPPPPLAFGLLQACSFGNRDM